MKIPKKFQLFGETVTVEFVDDLAEREDLVGKTSLGRNEIKLQSPSKNFSQNKIEQTFIHERTQIILHKLGERELWNNEKFVESFSNLEHQAIKTMEF